MRCLFPPPESHPYPDFVRGLGGVESFYTSEHHRFSITKNYGKPFGYVAYIIIVFAHNFVVFMYPMISLLIKNLAKLKSQCKSTLLLSFSHHCQLPKQFMSNHKIKPLLPIHHPLRFQSVVCTK